MFKGMRSTKLSAGGGGAGWDMSNIQCVASVNVGEVDGENLRSSTWMSPDGLNLITFNVPFLIVRFSLLVPWDLTTCSLQSDDIDASDMKSIYDLTMNPDGTKLLIIGISNSGDDRVLKQYNLSTPWNLNSASLQTTTDFNLANDLMYRVSYGNEGNVLYLYKDGSLNGNQGVQHYTISDYNIAGKSLDYTEDIPDIEDFYFKDDGLTLIYGTGSEYKTMTLSTPWDIRTGSIGSANDTTSCGGTPYRDFYISPDGINLVWTQYSNQLYSALIG